MFLPFFQPLLLKWENFFSWVSLKHLAHSGGELVASCVPEVQLLIARVLVKQACV